MKAHFVFVVMMMGVLIYACGKSGFEGANKLPGRAVYEQQNCGLCHGVNGEGKPTAPELKDLNEHWTVEQLVEYLDNPSKYAEDDPRLSQQGNKYPTMMPNYDFVTKEDKTKLAEYLLAL